MAGLAGLAGVRSIAHAHAYVRKVMSYRRAARAHIINYHGHPATPANSAVTVRQGDYFVVPPSVTGEMRNDGQDPASLVIAAITPGILPPP